MTGRLDIDALRRTPAYPFVEAAHYLDLPKSTLRERWVRFARQFGGLAKVDRLGVYAASFSVVSVVGSIT